MTTEFALAQLRHLYSLMLAGHVKDTGEAARGLLGPSIEALEKAALSSVPEDVARDHDAVESDLRTEGYTDTSNAMQALSRLATAAARVPGLEARVEDLTCQVKHAEEKRGEAEDLLEATERETRKVEAERDEQRARADHAESERDAAQRDLVGVINEHRALTARVAELERQGTADWNACCDVLVWTRSFRSDLPSPSRAVVAVIERLTAAEARATAAEAKVQKLEASLRENCGALGEALREGLTRSTPAPGLREAVGNALAYLRGLAMGGSRMDAEGEAALVSDLESAYAPTTEPVVTHAQLAAVVEEVAEEENHGAEPEGSAMAEAHDHGWTKGAREVLRRVTGGEVPEVLPKARVVEVLAHLNDIVGSSIPEYDRGWRHCVASARSMLGLTLPTGPGEGATKTDPVDAYWLGQKTAERMATHRARIAQTPKITNKDDSNDD